ncbi:hypothetical protein [Cryptosporangium sp. NPDC048952]|uniref:hypothetical protein n=1 Tax=Cryptosporangium sp. NPDC048952 TaxID=3363961 RepID=UPI0037149D3A
MTEAPDPARPPAPDDQQIAAVALQALATVFAGGEEQCEETYAAIAVLSAALVDEGRDAEAAALVALADWVRAGSAFAAAGRRFSIAAAGIPIFAGLTGGPPSDSDRRD